MLPLVLTFAIVAAVAGRLICQARGWRWPAFACKGLAPVGFVALAVGLGTLDHGVVARVILGGLVLGACGDVALAVPGRLSFAVGLGLFLCGQLTYVVAFGLLVPVSRWPWLAAIAPATVTVFLYRWLAPYLGRLRMPVLAYMTSSTAMVASALAIALAGTPPAMFLLGGALLFYVSDVFVARERFVKRSFVNDVLGLPIYYTAQILFAWATALAWTGSPAAATNVGGTPGRHSVAGLSRIASGGIGAADDARGDHLIRRAFAARSGAVLRAIARTLGGAALDAGQMDRDAVGGSAGAVIGRIAHARDRGAARARVGLEAFGAEHRATVAHVLAIALEERRPAHVGRGSNPVGGACITDPRAGLGDVAQIDGATAHHPRGLAAIAGANDRGSITHLGQITHGARGAAGETGIGGRAHAIGTSGHGLRTGLTIVGSPAACGFAAHAIRAETRGAIT